MTSHMEPKNMHPVSYLPDNALLTLKSVLPLFGNLSKSAWYAGIQQGKYPKPVKLGHRSRWTVGAIRAALNSIVGK